MEYSAICGFLGDHLLTSDVSRLTNLISSSGEVVAAVVVVVFSVAGFLDFPGFPACSTVGPVVCLAISVVAAVDFVVFFFYPIFQDFANLYAQPHPQIQVQLPVVLTK